MASTAIGRDDVMALSKVQPSAKFGVLDIGDRNMFSECAQELVKTALSLPTLRQLMLQVPSSVSPLDYIEKINGKLIILGFWSKDASSETKPSCSKFSDILKENTKLKVLRLFIPLRNTEVRAIVKSLKHNHTLAKLKLSKRYHSQYFSKAEQQALDHRIKWV